MKRIGASNTVLDWISQGVPLVFKHEPQRCFLSNRVQGTRQELFVNEEIEKLCRDQAITEVSSNEVHCVLPLRCVPKKQNKLRLVRDCRHVNECIECPTFSQEGIESVANQIEELFLTHF